MSEDKQITQEAYPEDAALCEPPKRIDTSRFSISAIRRYLRAQTVSRRAFKDFLFKILLGIVILIIIAPFFLVLLQMGQFGIGEFILEAGEEVGQGQGIEFVTTYPGAGRRGGVLHALIGTADLILVASIVGIPLSVFGAIYINEYTNPGLVRSAVEFGADVLAGIPSIVFGAFGHALFVQILFRDASGRGGYGLLSGALTLSFMMVPTVLRTTQEALRAVPMTLREASLALGATKWRTTWSVTIRAAFPGIVTGVLLAIGRIAGETAPLMLTSGTSLWPPSGIIGPESWTPSLPFAIYNYWREPAPYLERKAYGASLLLLLLVLTIDLIANFISRKVTRRLV